MLLNCTALAANVEKICHRREQLKADEEMRLYRTEIMDKIKKTVYENLLTDCFTETENPKPDVWFVDVKLDSELYREVNQDVIKSLGWMGLKAEIDETDALLDQYAIKFEFDKDLESQPDKRKELQSRGWDWNRLEKSRLQKSMNKVAAKQCSRLLNSIDSCMSNEPRSHEWSLHSDTLLSSRILEAVKVAFIAQGYKIFESWEKIIEKGKEKEEKSEVLEASKLKLTVHAPPKKKL